MPQVLLKDSFRSQFVNLNRQHFVIQRKVVPFEEAFLQNPEKQEEMESSLLSLIQERAERGIYNSDLKLVSNFGFLGRAAVELDFGNYKRSKDKALHEKANSRFVKQLALFKHEHR